MHKLGRLFIPLPYYLKSQRVRRCVGMGPQVHGLGLFLRRCQSEFLTCDNFNVHHLGERTRRCGEGYLGKVVPSWASSLGSTFSIPHGSGEGRSCRPDFALERDVLARLFRHGHLAWAPHLVFPTTVACFVKISRFDRNFPLRWSKAWLGISQSARQPVHRDPEIMVSGGVRSHTLECLLRLM